MKTPPAGYSPTDEVFGAGTHGRWIVNDHHEVLGLSEADAIDRARRTIPDLGEVWSIFPPALTCDECGHWPEGHYPYCSRY